MMETLKNGYISGYPFRWALIRHPCQCRRGEQSGSDPLTKSPENKYPERSDGNVQYLVSGKRNGVRYQILREKNN
jgi:hypothetical protein